MWERGVENQVRSLGSCLHGTMPKKDIRSLASSGQLDSCGEVTILYCFNLPITWNPGVGVGGGNGVRHASSGISRSKVSGPSLLAHPHQRVTLLSGLSTGGSSVTPAALLANSRLMLLLQMLRSCEGGAFAGTGNNDVRVCPEVPLASWGSLSVPPYPLNFLLTPTV